MTDETPQTDEEALKPAGVAYDNDTPPSATSTDLQPAQDAVSGDKLPEPAIDEEDLPLTPDTTQLDPEQTLDNSVKFDERQVDLRAVNRDRVAELLEQVERTSGFATLDKNVQIVGTWENIIYRTIAQPNEEALRIQGAIAALSPEDRSAMASRYREEGKLVLRGATPLTDPIPAGETKIVSGPAAKLAWAYQETGGAFRILLYNSGLSVDVTVPTGNDLQTLLVNSWTTDRELGTDNGAHYFAYNDQVYKTHVVTFLDALIVGSSFDNWQKRDQLWSLIKLPDLNPLLTTIAAICYPEGFDGFVTACTRTEPKPCHHTETVKANLFELVTTRMGALSRDAIAHMVEARSGRKHSLADIAKYQASLGFEGETVAFKDATFTMRIPSIAEHLEAGRKFITDILSEIEGDNTSGRYEQMGFRYIRSFIPWIARAERKSKLNGTLATSEPDAIEFALETLSDHDPDRTLITLFRNYVDRIQLSYVGHPITPCPECGYVEETLSGMRTFDPFAAFFTQALSYFAVSE